MGYLIKSNIQKKCCSCIICLLCSIIEFNVIMKLKYIIICLFSFLFTGCENEDNRDNNPCLIDKSVNFTLNGNLPGAADLIQFAGESMFIRDNINFIEGVYIRNINGNDFFIALELAEPNDCGNICSIPSSLTEGQFEYTCGDETTFYNLNGEKIDPDEDDFNMRPYLSLIHI